MRKKKRTLKPAELWDAGQVEQWLEAEARNGWRLTDCGNYLAVFETMEPGEYRVRVEPQRLETPEERRERGEAYREMGWDCTAVLPDGGQDYEVYYCADPAVPELHTDPAVYRWAWERSFRRSARSAWLQILWSVVMLLLPIVALLRDETPLQSLLMMPLLAMYVWLVMAPVFLIAAIRRMYTVQKFRRQLRADVVPTSGGDWKKRRRWWRAFVMVILVFWVLYLPGNIFWNHWSETAIEGLPYVGGTELLPETALEDWDLEAYERYGFPLNPTHYKMRMGTGGQRRVINTMDEVRFEFLAEALYQERLEEFLSDWQQEAEKTTLEHGAFDEAVLLSGGKNVQMLLVRSSNIVYSLWVNFPADMNVGLEKAAAYFPR